MRVLFRLGGVLYRVHGPKALLSRFIAGHAVCSRHRDLHGALDHFEVMLNLEQSDPDWTTLWEEDVSRLNLEFQEAIGLSPESDFGGYWSSETKQSLILLQYECRKRGSDIAAEVIEEVHDRLSRCWGRKVPDWFISRDDVEIHRWAIMKDENNQQPCGSMGDRENYRGQW